MMLSAQVSETDKNWGDSTCSSGVRFIRAVEAFVTLFGETKIHCNTMLVIMTPDMLSKPNLNVLISLKILYTKRGQFNFLVFIRATKIRANSTIWM
jgi:hypothetical protein